MSTAKQHCEHHARQLMVVEFFLWLKTTALQQLTKPGPLLRRQEYLCQGLQTKDVLLNGNTESLGHAAKHWVALKATLCDQTDKMLQNRSDYILQCKRMMIQG